MRVAQSLGRPIFFDEVCLFAADKRSARILVEMDTSEGLPETLKIIWGDKIIFQPLDYWKIPFMCLNCRGVGHLINSCKEPLRRRAVSEKIGKGSPSWLQRDKTVGNSHQKTWEKVGNYHNSLSTWSHSGKGGQKGTSQSPTRMGSQKGATETPNRMGSQNGVEIMLPY